MRREFKLQDPGEGVHEVEINEILVSTGDRVKEGQEVLVVESDKATIGLPSPYMGRVEEIEVSEGKIAEVGDILLVIEDEGAQAAEEREPEKKEPAPKAEEQPAAAGKEERVPRRTKAKAEREPRERGGPIKAAPAARKLAREEGMDLSDLEPSGSEGQITLEDVRAAHGEPAREREEGAEEVAAAEPVGARDDFGPIERVKLRSIRAATARAMARSWAEIPHVTHQDLADITDLERWRRQQVKAEGDETLTLTPFIVKAAAALLRRHPRFNARLDTESGEIVLRHYYNINVAVATERGLITPVVRDVDHKPVRALAHELAELTKRMHAGRASKRDLSGGSFTVTNVGGLGGISFAPIINPPQSAILGCARARLMPVVQGDVDDLDSAKIETRLMLPLILAFDHRILDGADAARFVNELAVLLGDVKTFALDV